MSESAMKAKRTWQREGSTLCANSGPAHSQQSAYAESLLDHLVGAGEQQGRHRKTQRPSGLSVDD